MSSDIANAVIEKIAEVKMISKNNISPDDLLADLDISSLDAVAIVYDIEDEYDIAIDNDKLSALRTVNDIIVGAEALIEEKK